MQKTLVTWIALAFSSVLLFLPVASIGSGEISIRLEQVQINIHDKASVERGATFFAKNCMSCHTMRYIEHNKLAEKAGILLDKMPLKNQTWWRGIAPPDLTLIASQKSPDWLFTYFHAFYKDPSRPTGYNNLLTPDVNMMNIFAAFQGEQALLPNAVKKEGFRKPHYYTLLELVRAGSMTPGEFNKTMTDLVNFLVYASDPHAAERESLGYWVLGFLAILFVLAFFLKKAYWKDVH